MAEFEVRIDRLRRNAENGQNIYRKMDTFSDRIYSIADGLVLESGTGRTVKKSWASLQVKHLTMQKKHRNCFIPLKVLLPVMNQANKKLLGKKETQMRGKKRKKASGQDFGKSMRQYPEM